MRESLLLGGLLTNIEGWINVTKQDLDDLEKPDTILLRKLFPSSGNASRAFMQLELGVIPVKFVVMQKRMNFLHYILNEDINSMIRQVFDALREDSRKGDFISLTKKDKIDLQIDKTDEEIADMTKGTWKKYVKEMVKSAAFKSLVQENNTKEKTRDIQFETLKISEYLERKKYENIPV